MKKRKKKNLFKLFFRSSYNLNTSLFGYFDCQIQPIHDSYCSDLYEMSELIYLSSETNKKRDNLSNESADYNDMHIWKTILLLLLFFKNEKKINIEKNLSFLSFLLYIYIKKE